jgi:hypothetical protein
MSELLLHYFIKKITIYIQRKIGVNIMKHRELNIMANVKIIENLKAQLLCIIGEFFRLLTKGSNVAQDAILDCISGAIIILYVLGRKLGYSLSEIDHVMKNKLDMGIRAEDEVEKDGKSLSELKNYISKRRD